MAMKHIQVQICDICGRQERNGLFYKCLVCGKEYCLSCTHKGGRLFSNAQNVCKVCAEDIKVAAVLVQQKNDRDMLRRKQRDELEAMTLEPEDG